MHSGPIAYEIATRRLALRCLGPEHAAAVTEAVTASLDHLRPWMPWAAREPEPLQAKARRLRGFRSKFDAGEDHHYGIFFCRDSDALIGAIGLHPRIGAGAAEIGYWIRVDRVGNGFATEAAAGLVRVAFRLDRLQRLEIHCEPANAASAAIPARLGFTHQVTVAGCVRGPDSAPRDDMIWAMERSAFEGSRAARAEIEAFGPMGERLS